METGVESNLASSHRGLGVRLFGPLAIARWEYFVVPDDADPSTCTVVEEWTDQRPLWYRAPADRLLGSRMTANQAGIVTTLANLKVAAETVSRKKTQPDR